ncbi:MAG: translation initiation factor IF-2 associated domain-containing protein, partial [Candidatus Contendobacter sp.]
MTDVTVKQFATVVGIPADRLLEQFTEAGITVAGADAAITEKQKLDLLAHLRKSHGDRPTQGAAEPRKITLKRKTHSEIKMTGGAAGQVKTVSIEVRKKRTYVKRSLEDDASRRREPEVQAEALDSLAVEPSEPRRPLEESEDARRVQEDAVRRPAAEAVSPPVAEEAVPRAPETDEGAGRQTPEEAPPSQQEVAETDRRQAEAVVARRAPEEVPRRRTEGEAPRRRPEDQARRPSEPG